MDIRTVPWPIFSANKRRKRIDPKPPYQRGPVWSLSAQQLFIDSILRGFDIPKIYLRKVEDKDYEWEILDGQQRLRAIWSFLGVEYSLSSESNKVNDHDISGKSYEELHEDLSDQLDSYVLDVVIVENANDEDVEDMFLRLQNGLPLNSAEKRNAISGKMRDFIRDVAASNKLMKNSVPFQDRRYSHAEVVAQMMRIELNGGPTSVRHQQLKTMYENNKVFSKTSKEAKESHDISVKGFPKEIARTH